MQDPSNFQPINPQFPEQEQLKCPRCDSMNTKFCYYNNYNLSQPRHFCKNCRRYWTKGGALRNVPVGGGSRKNTKRSSNHNRSSSSSVQNVGSEIESASPNASASDRGSSSFLSLLGSNVQFGNWMEDLNPNGANIRTLELGGFGETPGSFENAQLELHSNNNAEGFVGSQQRNDTSCWGDGNGSADLAIHSPGSILQ